LLWSLAFSADGKFLACGDSHGIRLFDTNTFREVRRFEADDNSNLLSAVAFSADAKSLAAIAYDIVSLWT